MKAAGGGGLSTTDWSLGSQVRDLSHAWYSHCTPVEGELGVWQYFGCKWHIECRVLAKHLKIYYDQIYSLGLVVKARMLLGWMWDGELGLVCFQGRTMAWLTPHDVQSQSQSLPSHRLQMFSTWVAFSAGTEIMERGNTTDKAQKINHFHYLINHNIIIRISRCSWSCKHIRSWIHLNQKLWTSYMQWVNNETNARCHISIPEDRWKQGSSIGHLTYC